MSARTDWGVVVGYADRLSALPGERLRVMASSAAELEATVVRLPGGGPAPIEIAAIAARGRQPVRTGACVEVPHDPALRPAGGLVVATWAWLAPGAPTGRRRVLISSWSPDGADGFALWLEPDGRPGFEVASGGRRDRVVAGAAIALGVWSRIEGALDPAAGTISISRFEGERRVDSSLEAASLAAPGDSPGPLLLGAERSRSGAAESHLDGKLDRPTVLAGPPATPTTVAAWALGEGRGPTGRRPRTARSARPLRQRPDPRGHRPRLDRGGSRLASRRRAVRGDALSLRRRR